MSLQTNFHKTVLLFVLYLTITCLAGGLSAGTALADQKETDKIEGAKKEGAFMLYAGINVQDATKLLNGYKKKYPFLKAELYRAPAEKLFNRIMIESRAKRYIPDAFLLNFKTNYQVRKEGLTAKYTSPESLVYPKEFKDPEGYWTSSFVVTRVLAYNTNLVASREVPRSYEELLDAKWKGKIGLETEENDWFASTLEMMGREKGLEFMRNLAAQNIHFHTGRNLLAQLLAAGEFSLEPQLNGHEVEALKMRGAPIEWVALEPILSFPMPIAVATHANHPYAAKLFVDFVLSREGQEIMRSVNRIPCHPDVPPNPPRLIKGLKLLPYNIAWAENVEQNMKLFRDIFLRKTGK